MTAPFREHDNRLADAFGRPIRGFPWWKSELTEEMWINLHTGWLVWRPPFHDKLESICFVLARTEYEGIDFRLDIAAFAHANPRFSWLKPREIFCAVKWALEKLAGRA